MQRDGATSVSSWSSACSLRCGHSRTTRALLGIFLALPLVACTQTDAVIESVDFPRSDVPLAVGTSSPVIKTGSMWNLSVAVDNEDAQRAALSALLDKGFQVIGQSDPASADVSYSLADPTYSVRLGFRKTDNNFSVAYGVAKRPNSGGETQ